MANNIVVKDALGVNQIVKTTDNTGVHTHHHNVDSVPADPFGLNADAMVAAGATGSIQAKLRRLTNDLNTLLGFTDGIETLLAGGLPAALVNGRLKVGPEHSRTASAADKHAPAVNTAAVVTFAATGGVSHVIGGILWSLDADPAAPVNCKVEDGSGTTVRTFDITKGGPGFIPFGEPLKGTVNTDLIITLAAGGGGITGKVNALGHWTE